MSRVSAVMINPVYPLRLPLLNLIGMIGRSERILSFESRLWPLSLI